MCEYDFILWVAGNIFLELTFFDGSFKVIIAPSRFQ